MRVELVCTGDELVTGLIADTNSPYFEARLFDLGVKVQRVTLVGDVREDITRALQEAAARADAVLVSGGLGPTADDFTAECAARAAGVELVEDARALAAIRERFARRGTAFTPNNARPAQVPAGAEVVLNPVGTAPMFILQLGACRFYFVPGVPREYRALVDGEVLPRLRAQVQAQPGRTHRAFRLLRTVGLPESHLDAAVAPLAQAHPRVVFGFRTEAPENHLKLMAEAPSQAEAEAALAEAEAAARAVLGSAVYAADAEDYAQALVRRLADAGRTLAVAESCTGGLISAQLTDVSGASRVFLGGAVVYAEAMKSTWASVAPSLLAAHGAVSREVAEALASGVRAQAGADYGLAVTGFAGPGGGTPENPVGTVYCALAGPAGLLRCERRHFAGGRERVRLFAASATLELLRQHLLSSTP
ncbi:competence/damage-inducible protein A [Aggregicoccus sp. 17bor-14]|uniref:competence/damage-inducible protein A n=1 Tax=Myxococcaceae TaxID=31 RepID=UPI00129C4E83|nr:MULTISPECIES: competence/damage-inducible protein A [Myxococcaceae]MBF5043708.1 competence/damage-inducible protein A [Simulacricoccus sp. 17bor-14]MRI89464.1 competence/damage-inducible protein A [Aggregicoccus sp. 17bor-14]